MGSAPFVHRGKSERAEGVPGVRPRRSARLAGDEGVQDRPLGCPTVSQDRRLGGDELGKRPRGATRFERRGGRRRLRDGGILRARDEHHRERGKGGIEPDDAARASRWVFTAAIAGSALAVGTVHTITLCVVTGGWLNYSTIVCASPLGRNFDTSTCQKGWRTASRRPVASSPFGGRRRHVLPAFACALGPFATANVPRTAYPRPTGAGWSRTHCEGAGKTEEGPATRAFRGGGDRTNTVSASP